MHHVSVTSPVGPALERIRAVLFAPFDLEKWLKLGFCAFLAGLLSGGGGSGGYYGGGPWETDEHAVERELEQARHWLEENMALAVGVVTAVFLAITAVTLVLLWLRARGRFMFLDGVVRDRGAVSEPWRDYRAEANSAFAFEVVFGFAMLLAVGLSGVLGVALAWVDIRAERFGSAATGGLVVFALLAVALGITAAVVALLLKDFVTPAMYAHRVGVMEGWRIVHREVLAPRVGTIVLYVLMKVLISIVAGALVVAAGCLTLCVGFCLMAIPYVGSVVLLPITVFDRAFSLHFLGQLGGPWKLIPDEPEPVPDDGGW